MKHFFLTDNEPSALNWLVNKKFISKVSAYDIIREKGCYNIACSNLA